MVLMLPYKIPIEIKAYTIDYGQREIRFIIPKPYLKAIECMDNFIRNGINYDCTLVDNVGEEDNRILTSCRVIGSWSNTHTNGYLMRFDYLLKSVDNMFNYKIKLINNYKFK